jgi:hypothetical protein
MKKVPKTIVEFVVQSWYPEYKWEDVFYATTLTEGKAILNDYNQNETGVPHRLIKRRVKNPAYKG